MNDPYELAEQAAFFIRDAVQISGIDLAMVLGSGWASAVDQLGEPIARLTLADIPGFSAPCVEGHGGELIVLRAESGLTVGVLTGRTHLYEGRGVASTVHGVRTMAALGATALVLTNASGSLHPEWEPGTVVAIRDHINLTGSTPLVGARFVDLSHTWTPALIDRIHEVDPDIPTGVYVQFAGPNYETPAEVRMAGILGGDLVGMSTALEAIAAAEYGMQVVGLSLATNLAAGVSEELLDHADVLERAEAAKARLATLLAGFVAATPFSPEAGSHA